MTCAPAPVLRLLRAAKRPRPSPVPGAQRSVCARPSSPVPPPQRPFRRQCRSAASRTAGTSGKRQQPTGAPRPPSQGKSRKGPQSLPGFRRQAAETGRIIFPGGAPQGGLSCPFGAIHLLYAGENPFQAASVDHGRPWRPWSARSQPVCPFAETGRAGLREGLLAQMFLGTFGRIFFRLPTSPAASAAGRRSGPGSCCPGPGSA